MRGLIAANEEFGGAGKGRLAGTSNVHFAQKYNIAPIGTIAHEWIMGVAALTGYEGSNGRAMDLWEKSFPSGALSIALTDTFSTKPFFDDFVSDPERANRWKGLRQDSGSPFKFISLAKEAFERVGADPKQSALLLLLPMRITNADLRAPTEIVVFSDGLDVAKAIELKKASDEAGVGCSFGVGTTFTNDFVKNESPVEQDVPGEGEPRAGEPSKALNM